MYVNLKKIKIDLTYFMIIRFKKKLYNCILFMKCTDDLF